MHSLIKQSANSIENPWLIKAKLDDMPDIIWLETENWCKNILEMFLITNNKLLVDLGVLKDSFPAYYQHNLALKKLTYLI